jgi:hypothetical protein
MLKCLFELRLCICYWNYELSDGRCGVYIYNFCPQFLCLHFYVLAKVYHGVVAKQQEEELCGPSCTSATGSQQLADALEQSSLSY